MHRLVGRSSKRLRGETVDKLSMFDDPEAAARRLRQATQHDPSTHTDPSPGTNPALNPSRPSRAVHFQEPSAPLTSPEAMQDDEGNQDNHQQHQEHIDLDNGTPHTAVTHGGKIPDTAASELRLTLSASASAAQPPKLPAQLQDGAGHSALHALPAVDEAMLDAHAQMPHSAVQHSQSVPQPSTMHAQLSDIAQDAALHAVPAAGDITLEAPTTAGRAVASSQDSLRIAAERAQAIAKAQALSTAAADAAMTTASALSPTDASPTHAFPLQPAAATAPVVPEARAERCDGKTADANRAPGCPVLPETGQALTDGAGPLSVHAPEAQQLVNGQRQGAAPGQECDGTVLVTTTRPNVPDSKRPGVMPSKSMPVLHKATSNGKLEMVSLSSSML